MNKKQFCAMLNRMAQDELEGYGEYLQMSKHLSGEDSKVFAEMSRDEFNHLMEIQRLAAKHGCNLPSEKR